MEHFRIVGGTSLSGAVAVSGAKNAALPIMAASILAGGPVHLESLPNVSDVRTLAQLLRELGVTNANRCLSACGISTGRRAASATLQYSADSPLALDSPLGMRLETVDTRPVVARYELVRRMRASFCVLGPLLARRGRAVVALPGGCNLGPRPVDLHLAGLTALGADVRIERGYVTARAKRLRGATISLRGPRGPTVTGTANVMSAAVLARGVTTILGAAAEPEIVDLGRFLNALGAKITGLGTSTLRIVGVEELGGADHRIIPDRIEAATLLLAGAITGGSVTVTGVVPEHMTAVLALLTEAGARVETGPDRVTIALTQPLRAINVSAEPYPGIPSDLQAQFVALAALAEGRSTLCDRVFPNRFAHVDELNRFGARIRFCGDGVAVEGVRRLSGTIVAASDLRAGAALVLAGLAAMGETRVTGIAHLDRGYAGLDAKLSRLGAQIQRVMVPTECLLSSST